MLFVKPPLVELLVLGPPQIRSVGVELSLGSRKGWALLTLLAMRGPQTRGELTELLWGDFIEARGRMNLRRELQRLRDAGLRDAIRTRGEHLELHSFSCDARDFLNGSENKTAIKTLSLWRGELLEGFELDKSGAFGHWLEEQRFALRRAYLEALERDAMRLEGVGATREAMTRWARVLELDELNEVGYRALIRLHGQLGEREQALMCFERLEQMLRRELSLTPLPETTATLKAVLETSSGASLSTSAAVLPTPSDGLEWPLVGREVELERLRSARGPVLLLGAPGTGKSRLAREALPEPHLTLQGREDWRSSALAPIEALLRSNAGVLERLEPPLSPALQRTVQRLLTPRSASLEPPSVDAGARLLEEVTRILKRWLEVTPALLIDDWICFDEASQTILRMLLRNAGDARIIVTLNEAEVASVGVESLTVLRLQGLEPMAISALMATALPRHRGDQDLVARLHAATAGHPLYVLETLNHWRVQARNWPLETDDFPLPSAVETAILERIHRLNAVGRRILEAASLVGSHFSILDLGDATALGETDVLEGLESCVGVQVIRRIETSASNSSDFRFAHEVLRRQIRDGIPATRKRLLHARLAARALELNALPERLAEHLEAAHDWVAAAQQRLLAAHRLRNLNLLREASTQIARALELADLPQTRTEALLLLGHVQHEMAEYEGASMHFERAEALARALHDDALLAESLIGQTRVAGGVSEYANVLERAMEALQLSERAARPALLAQALYWLGNTEFHQGDVNAARLHLERAVRVHADLDDPTRYATIIMLLGRLEAQAGHNTKAFAHFKNALEINRRFDYDKGVALCLTGMSWLTLLEGRFKESEKLARESLEMYRQIKARWQIANASLNLGHALLGQKRVALSAAAFLESMQIALELGALNIMLEVAVGAARLAPNDLARAWLLFAVGHERSTSEIRDFARPDLERLGLTEVVTSDETSLEMISQKIVKFLEEASITT